MKNWILYLFKLPLILHLFDYLKILKKEKKKFWCTLVGQAPDPPPTHNTNSDTQLIVAFFHADK